MPLRFGIPLTIILGGLASYISAVTNLEVFAPMAVMTAAWCAWDSHKIGAAKYRSAIAIPPLGVLMVVILLWPITLPWYLKLRSNIRLGKAEVREHPPEIKPFLIGAAVVLALMGGCWLSVWLPNRKEFANLGKVPDALYREFHIQANININNSKYMLISAVNPSDSQLDSLKKEDYAKRVAEVAVRSYKTNEPLETVSIGVLTIKGSSFFNMKRTYPLHEFSYADLNTK